MKITYDYKLRGKNVNNFKVFDSYDTYRNALLDENLPNYTPNASQKKKTTLNIWMSKDYPIHFKVIP